MNTSSVKELRNEVEGLNYMINRANDWEDTSKLTKKIKTKWEIKRNGLLIEIEKMNNNK